MPNLRAFSRNGSTFIGVRCYNSKGTGEVSNQTIIGGYDYAAAKERDLPKIQAANAADLAQKLGFDLALVEKAMAAILKTNQNPDAVLSEAQKAAYKHIGNGLKLHLETGDLHVHGLLVKKKTLQAGTYKPETAYAECRRKIEKELDLSIAKIRQFKLERGTFNLRGVTVE
jgi:hypothetical protein